MTLDTPTINYGFKENGLALAYLVVKFAGNRLQLSLQALSLEAPRLFTYLLARWLVHSWWLLFPLV